MWILYFITRDQWVNRCPFEVLTHWDPNWLTWQDNQETEYLLHDTKLFNGCHFIENTLNVLFLPILVHISVRLIPKITIGPGLLVLAWCWIGESFENTFELLNLRALRISILCQNQICQSMGKMFCVEFQRFPQWVNSLRPSDAYMPRQPKPSMIQIMACRLFGAKPLSEPMLEYC